MGLASNGMTLCYAFAAFLKQLVFAVAELLNKTIIFSDCLQAYGDAVIDEAPLLFISNYHCTVFLKRSEHVHNKTLWASEPIWWDQQHPSARSCWLKFLCVADEMQEVKAKLPRMVVPRTADGYMLPKVSVVVPHPAPNRSLRPRPQKTIRLMASSITRKGYDVVPCKPAYGTSTSSLQQQLAGSVEGDIFALY